MAVAPRISRLGERAWLVDFGGGAELDAGVNERVLALAERVRGARWPGVRDVVPAAATLAVHVAPDVAGAGHIPAALAELLAEPLASTRRSTTSVEVPVCYGGEFGPDLEDVARLASLTPDDVIRLHTAIEYRVFMVGFLPGFPYLGAVDPAIRVARRGEPRARVPAGSIGLAGSQTGIYPIDSPGGWQIVGRTPLRLFDPAASPPARLQPGDRVRFVAAGLEVFADVQAGPGGRW